MYESPTEIMRKVGEFLREPLSLDIPVLQGQLTGLEALRYDLADKRTQWYQTLAEKKNQMLYPKDKEKTELDRKVMLNASVALIEKDYLFLVALEELIQERLQLGKQLLSLVWFFSGF